MEYNVTSPILFAASCLVFMVSGLLCSLIRWCHMCKPYDADEQRYYPARRSVTMFFFGMITQFPYLINPMDDALWMYERIWGVLYFPVLNSLLLRRYFRKDNVRNSIKYRVYFLSPFSILLIMLGIIVADRQLLIDNSTLFMAVTGFISVMLVIDYFGVSVWLSRSVSKFNMQNYSNAEDFPYALARGVLFFPVVPLVMSWAVFISGSHWVKFVCDIVFTIWMVIFLIVVLHPQPDKLILERRNGNTPTHEDAKMLDDMLNDDGGTIGESVDGHVRAETWTEEDVAEVTAVIKRRFREPHLSKTEVINSVSFGHKTGADAFIKSVGYYNLVNAMRLEYARQYKEKHPDSTSDCIAAESGFTSRYMLYRARKNVAGVDANLILGVKLME